MPVLKTTLVRPSNLGQKARNSYAGETNSAGENIVFKDGLIPRELLTPIMNSKPLIMTVSFSDFIFHGNKKRQVCHFIYFRRQGKNWSFFNCHDKINKGGKDIVKELSNVFNEKLLILKRKLKILKISLGRGILLLK